MIASLDSKKTLYLFPGDDKKVVINYGTFLGYTGSQRKPSHLVREHITLTKYESQDTPPPP